jgi:hypothetical protein
MLDSISRAWNKVIPQAVGLRRTWTSRDKTGRAVQRKANISTAGAAGAVARSSGEEAVGEAVVEGEGRNHPFKSTGGPPSGDQDRKSRSLTKAISRAR